MCFGLAQLYVAVTSACMSIKQVLGGVVLVIVTNFFPLLYCYSCRGSFTCMFVDRMILKIVKNVIYMEVESETWKLKLIKYFCCDI